VPADCYPKVQKLLMYAYFHSEVDPDFNYVSYKTVATGVETVLYWSIIADAMCMGYDALILEQQRNKGSDSFAARLSYETELCI
jgi:hypothetical protein